MAVTEAQVRDALRRVKGPDLSGNIVDLGLLSEVLIKDGRVYFAITVPPERASELEPLREAAQKVVAQLEGVQAVTAVLTAETRRAAPPPQAVAGPRESARVAEARARGGAGDGARPAAEAAGPRKAAGVPGVKHLIAVASGKGGVGKSTTAVNLALGLQALGLKVGVLDADIYGPSQPRLLGLSGRPKSVDGRLRPLVAYGLEVMSMGFLIEEDTPIIWRGPMVVSALQQMLREVAWGTTSTGGTGLDAIVIDMPPGTGDIQLSMAQQVPLSGAVIVSTPQDLALIDARKGLAMFRRVDVPVLGIIENMSYFVCPKCGERSDIFGHGGAEHEAEKLELPFLGAVPLHIDIRTRSDSGQPIVATSPEGPHAKIYRDIAARAWAEVERAKSGSTTAPELTVADGGTKLVVRFEGGERHELTAEMLRVMSPSAEVQGHSPDQRVTVAGKRNVRINELRPVGHYAVRIAFDDGHDTGLYAWSYLALLGREKDKRWQEYLDELAAKKLSR